MLVIVSIVFLMDLAIHFGRATCALIVSLFPRIEKFSNVVELRAVGFHFLSTQTSFHICIKS